MAWAATNGACSCSVDLAGLPTSTFTHCMDYLALILTIFSLWLQGVALTLTPLANEFGISGNDSRFATCALFVGLIVGASFWGIASDIVGRRPAFNCTLLICGAFGLAAGGGPNWVG